LTCRKILSAVTLASTLCLAGFAGAQAPNSMLARYGNEFRTLHTLPLRIGADDSLTAAGPTDRSAVFNDVPFDISLAAFIADDQAIMVHAEQVADGSGAANYTRYELSNWPIPGFRQKPLDCLEVSAEIVNSEHDLAWLREHGFNPAGVIWKLSSPCWCAGLIATWNRPRGLRNCGQPCRSTRIMIDAEMSIGRNTPHPTKA
jgi:hypothetical protein